MTVPADFTVGDRVTWAYEGDVPVAAVVVRVGAARVTVAFDRYEPPSEARASVTAARLTPRTTKASIDRIIGTLGAPAPKNAARLAALEHVNARRRLRQNETTAAYRVRMAEDTATAFGNLSPEDRGRVIAAGLAAKPAPF